MPIAASKYEQQSISSVTKVRGKVKVVFLGQQSTGKTSILMRFLNGKFQQTQGPTVGIDFMGKNYSIGTTHLRLQLWDTAGQQRFRSLIPSYLKDAMVTLIVFDLTNQKSFDNLGQWVELCHNNRNEKNIIIFLGNKNDLYDLREISQQKINQKLSQLNKNFKYFEVSAKNGHNIDQVFQYACEQFVKNNMQQNQLTFSQINQQMNKRFNKNINNQVIQSSNSKDTKSQNFKKDKKQKSKNKEKEKDAEKTVENIKINNINKDQINRKKKKKCC